MPTHEEVITGMAEALTNANRVIEQMATDLDLANARVAVLREGLEEAAPVIRAFEHDLLHEGRMEEWDAVIAQMIAIAALLASPDEAATKLLAVRDAAMAVVKEPGAMTACDCADGPGWEYACPRCQLERVVASLSATGPGTGEGGQG